MAHFDRPERAIRYVEVKTRNWWPGKKVLVSPHWIKSVSWVDSKVYVNLSREKIRSGPKYVESKPITREFERQLWAHFGWPPYWEIDVEEKKSPATLSAGKG